MLFATVAGQPDLLATLLQLGDALCIVRTDAFRTADTLPVVGGGQVSGT